MYEKKKLVVEQLFDTLAVTGPDTQEPGQGLAASWTVSADPQADRDRLLRHEREARTAAEGANRSKDEFLAMLGHELRNPLAAISNGVAVVSEHSEDTAPLVAGTHFLSARVNALGHVATALLEDEPALAEVFSKEFIGLYAGVKRGEFETFMQVISPWEREFLLLNV